MKKVTCNLKYLEKRFVTCLLHILEKKLTCYMVIWLFEEGDVQLEILRRDKRTCYLATYQF